MTAKFVAENVPAYDVESWLEKPWRDEDLGLTAREVIMRGETEAECLGGLLAELVKTASYYRNQPVPTEHHLREFELFNAAAVMVSHGSTAVKIHGRYYRVRPVNEHGF